MKVFILLVAVAVLISVADAIYYKGHCGVNAWYKHGKCVCWKHYYGNPHKLCRRRKCGKYAYWKKRRCVCKPHYKGNPYRKRGCHYYKKY